MSQLTIRGFDDALRGRIEQIARERGSSLNRAALLLLRRGAGLDPEAPPPANVVGDSLDEFVGAWTRAEERRFLDAIDVLDRIDEALWR